MDGDDRAAVLTGHLYEHLLPGEIVHGPEGQGAGTIAGRKEQERTLRLKGLHERAGVCAAVLTRYGRQERSKRLKLKEQFLGYHAQVGAGLGYLVHEQDGFRAAQRMVGYDYGTLAQAVAEALGVKHSKLDIHPCRRAFKEFCRLILKVLFKEIVDKLYVDELP
jgi:hypothetical protein